MQVLIGFFTIVGLLKQFLFLKLIDCTAFIASPLTVLEVLMQRLHHVLRLDGADGVKVGRRRRRRRRGDGDRRLSGDRRARRRGRRGAAGGDGGGGGGGGHHVVVVARRAGDGGTAA